LIAKLTVVAFLVAGSLTGWPAAGAGHSSPIKGDSQVHPQTPGNCPSNSEPDAVLAQASEALRASRFHDAATILQPLAAKNCDPRISLLLAAALEGQGDLLAATTELRRAHGLWPSNSSIASSLAREYLAAGDQEDAAKALTHFRVSSKTPEQEMRMAVVIYLASHQLLLAQSVAAVAYKTYPSVQTLLLFANTLQMQGRYPDVIRLLGAQRAAYTGSPQFLVTLAESEYDASTYEAARNDLKNALTLDPGLYQAHYLMGNVLFKLNDADEAAAEYHKAIDLAPSQPRAWFQLALLLRTQHGGNGEREALAQTLAVDEHYGPAQCEMGRMLLDEHHPAEAVSHLTEAIQDNPRFEKAWFLLARAYAQLGEHDKSEQAARRLSVIRKESQVPMGGRMSDFPGENQP